LQANSGAGGSAPARPSTNFQAPEKLQSPGFNEHYTPIGSW